MLEAVKEGDKVNFAADKIQGATTRHASRL